MTGSCGGNADAQRRVSAVTILGAMWDDEREIKVR
jgi:hypothetical protein